MRGPGRWGLVVAGLPLAVVLALGPGVVRNRSAAQSGPLSLPAAAGAGGRLVGSGSCSGTSCHGSIAPVAGSSVLRNEHTTWISDDPHARAYQVLLDPRSEQIVRKLAAGRESWTPAHEDARCLACHATPRRAEELAATSWMNEDGVGCESCHGAAARWLGPHTTAGWSRLDPAAKEAQFGLIPTASLARRAGICAGCHVGRRADPSGVIDRDVNHDLIAAGHPRLSFEFAAYLANLTPHWVEKGDNNAPDFPARAWAIGQVATARAAAELLKGRAADETAPWPEFSESSCFACHHSLADQAWRQAPAGGVGLVGQPAWGSWYGPMTRTLAEQSGQPGVLEAYDQLGARMTRSLPDRGKAAEQAERLARSLGSWLATLEALHLDRTAVAQWLAAFNDPAAWKTVNGWDPAAQRYLALVPLYQTLHRMDGAPDAALRAELDRLLRSLAFPEGWDGPGRDFDPASLPER